MRILNILSLLFILCLYSCKEQSKSENTICVSIAPLEFFVKEIAGDRFKTSILIPTGSSPETYEPTVSDMKRASSATTVIIIGAMECEESLNQYIKEDKIVRLNTNFKGNDPHFWLSIDGARSIATDIFNEVSLRDSINTQEYKDNYNALIKKIDSLDNYIISKFNDIPVQNRSFILFHPTLGYIASQYGLEQIAIEKDGKEPTIENIKNIVSRAKSEGIKEIFIQREFDSNSIQSIKNETSATEIIIEPLSEEWLKNIYSLVDTLAYSMKNRR